MSDETEESSQYKDQLEIINNLLNSTPEGSERDELISLKQNIEELLALTDDEALKNNEPNNSASLANEFIEPNSNSSNNSGNNSNIDDEYALFMAEMEGSASKAADVDNVAKIEIRANLMTSEYKDLEGKKFKAPHKHQWGQLMYHNAMICSVSDDDTDSKELLVKVLFLNPTHSEMLPCPYYFDCERDCRFNEEQCRFSHGEFVPFTSLQKYIEPNFEDLTIGSNVLAKQEDNLWYKAKITRIKKEKCFVKFESKNVRIKQNEEILFKDIFPLDCAEDLNNTSAEDSGNEEKASIEDDPKGHQVELINKSLLINPGFTRLGEWEQYTKGIGSRLMQKMGYIVGTGLGKGGSGIVTPVSAIVLPQGKSLDFCMNLKEQRNDPELFNAERVARQKTKKKFGKRLNRLQKKINFKQLELDKYIEWNLKYNKEIVKNEEYNMLKDKLRNSTNEETNVANFVIEKRFKELKKSIEDLKLNIQRLEELHQEPKTLYRTFNERSIELKRINEYKKCIDAEIDRRKNNKEMAVF